MIKNQEGMRVRQTIARLVPQYVETLVQQFRTSPEELLQRVEARLESEKRRGDPQPIQGSG
jgi:hypothetical protein